MLHITKKGFVITSSDGVEIEGCESIDYNPTQEEFEKISNGYFAKVENGLLILEETEISKENEYKNSRKREYPKIEDYIDAQVKKSSADPKIVQEGEEQEAIYLSKCLLIKEKYPKPIS